MYAYGFMHEVIVLRHPQISGAHMRIVLPNNTEDRKRLPINASTFIVPNSVDNDEHEVITGQ